MELDGYIIDNVALSVSSITLSRDALKEKGKGQEYQNFLMEGVEIGKKAFGDAQKHTLLTIITAELIFLKNERKYFKRKPTVDSLEIGILQLNSAINALRVLDEPEKYRYAEATYAVTKGFRYYGVPKDAFLVACISHKARLENAMKASTTDDLTFELLEQRVANMETAKKNYFAKQKEVLGF